MAKTIVDRILDQISRLTPAQQRLLERRLAAKADAAWEKAAGKARADAKARGIDQAAIDRAVHKSRHGQ